LARDSQHKGLPNCGGPPRNRMGSTHQDPIDPLLKSEAGKGMDREQWARLKDTIHHLYIDQNLNCKQVAAILREQHDDRVR
jgi:hypothetical protein